MAIGMTYEQYWYGDPLMVRAFYKADKIRQQRLVEEAWLNGAYVLRAIDATVGNIVRKKGAEPAVYPKEPFRLEEEPKKTQTEEDKQKEEEKERLRLVAYLNKVAESRKN